MRLSVATKIFMAFTVVIIAFGSASVYTLVRMSELRESISLVLEEVTPVATRLNMLSRRLRAPDEFLNLRRSSDSQWIQRLLPTIEVFEVLDDVSTSLQEILAHSALADPDREVLTEVQANVDAFRSNRALSKMIPPTMLMDAAKPLKSADNVSVFTWLVARTVRLAAADRLEEGSIEARVMSRVLRQTDRVVVEAARAVSTPIRSLNQRARSDEQAARVAVALITVGASLLSLLMLLMSQLTLAPIRRLQEGVRRIAAGETHGELRIRSRDEIGELAREFDRMVTALGQRDLALAKQRAELIRADRLATIGRMAAQVTHEVRNPLLSIGLNAELLEEELSSRLEHDADGSVEESVALLNAIQGEVDRLKAITEEYLRYARMPNPDIAEVEPGVLLQEFLSFLTHELSDAEITVVGHGLSPHEGGGAAPIYADRDQLRQALMNVARNAIEALRTCDGPRRLEVSLKDDGHEVMIAIGDNGPGIDPELMDRLFEPFVTSKPGGTGLGLSLTHQIISAHGGRIAVQSPLDDGGGVRFELFVPRHGPESTHRDAGEAS